MTLFPPFSSSRCRRRRLPPFYSPLPDPTLSISHQLLLSHSLSPSLPSRAIHCATKPWPLTPAAAPHLVRSNRSLFGSHSIWSPCRFLAKIWIPVRGKFRFCCCFFGRIVARWSSVKPAPGHQLLPISAHPPLRWAAPPRFRQPLCFVPFPRGVRDAATPRTPHAVRRRGWRRPAAASELDWPVPADALHPNVHR